MSRRETHSLADIVEWSVQTQKVLHLAHKAGATRLPVLLLGETGTGKELVARAIHNVNSIGAFVVIDCSALAGPLMESELFGHARGSFTGAVAAKVGLIEMANGGTVFLDEIGELPLDLQAKLLRVLQEKEFRPVGSLLQHKSDFRIIAASNRNLAREVERGTFRHDLFYRLNVVTLRLSPLRDRKEDIRLLIDLFLARDGRNHKLTPEALDAMMSYDWPGNIRELENCILRMVAIHTGPLLHADDLPSSIQNVLLTRRSRYLSTSASASCQAGVAVKTNVGIEPQFSSAVTPLREMERHSIVQALEYTKGDRAQAAQMLGIGRTTLYRKLKEYQLTNQTENVISGPSNPSSARRTMGVDARTDREQDEGFAA